MKFFGKSISIPEIAVKALDHKLEYEHHPIPNEEGFKVRWKNFSEIASYYLIQGLDGNVKQVYNQWYENHCSTRRHNRKPRLRADSLRLGDESDMTTSIGLEKQLTSKKMEAFEYEIQGYFFYAFINRIQKSVDLATMLKVFDDTLTANEGMSGMTRGMPEFLTHLRKKIIEDSGESPLEQKVNVEEKPITRADMTKHLDGEGV